MDPLHQRVEQSQVTPLHHIGDDNNEVTESPCDPDVNRVSVTESESGFDYNNGNIVFDEFGPEFDEGSEGEIRMITLASSSDDEREIWGIDLNGGDVYEDEDDVSVTIPLVLDSVGGGDLGVTADEYDWEEVAAEEREMLSVFAEADVSNELETGSGNVGWEVLLNTPPLEINFDASREVYIVGDNDAVIQSADYEALFEQFAQAGIANLRSPPTSNSFVNNLPMVALEAEDDDGLVCAVCKDEMNTGSKAVQLPCSHKYHSECILPWLGIRNTCPVCRYEMPTDDVDYERRKSYTTTSHGFVL